MTLHLLPKSRTQRLALVLVLNAIGVTQTLGQAGNETILPKPAGCRVEAVDYKGWRAEQVSNRWVQLIVVPQNGGRLMQVSFAGHPYLFINPKFAGKYLPPD